MTFFVKCAMEEYILFTRNKNRQKSKFEKDDTMIPMMLSYFKVSLNPTLHGL